MSEKRGNLSILIFCSIIFGIGFYSGSFYTHASSYIPNDTIANTSPEEDMKFNADFAPFWKAWSILNERFVPVATSTTLASEEDRIWGAIQGLSKSYNDPYTVFFPPEEAKSFEMEIQGNFEGVGMEIGMRDELLTVIAPLKGTPADKAGILPGDQIISIDDVSALDLSIEEAIQKIRGEKGTTVKLTVAREGKGTLDIPIVRAVIEIPTVDTKPVFASDGSNKGSGLRSDGTFLIRLYNFSAHSTNDFQKALNEFTNSGSHKLILDLRGNPGGFLDAAVEMASWFLPTGTPVVIQDFGKGKGEQVLRSKGYDIFNKMGVKLDMVILVNGGSASASEILAGALSEHDVATIVGTQTFGKGSVQELIPLTSETSLKITIARWLTPHSISISENGITPDVIIPLSLEDIEKGKDPQLDRAVKILTDI